MKKEFELVKVIWKDAQTFMGVLSIDEVKKRTLCLTHTIGYLVDEDKERIAICGVYHLPDDEQEQAGFKDVHFIPKKWIEKLIKLKELPCHIRTIKRKKQAKVG